MKITKVSLVYFSATYTTQRIVKRIARELGIADVQEYDITQTPLNTEIQMAPDELLLVGMPVYGGRIPALTLKSLQQIKGNHSPAIITCVYGNRDYDDALLELKNVVEENGFKVISAGAFIAQHSIFPAVGSKRPDDADEAIVADFGRQNAELIRNTEDILSLPGIKVKGNYPYKVPGGSGMYPTGDDACDGCGTCFGLCPVSAIPEQNPKETDGTKCIQCGRCIVVCPQNSRNFRGEAYTMMSAKFSAAFSARKEPEIMLPQ